MTSAANKERTVGRSIDDASATVSLRTRLRRHGNLGGVSVEVVDGLALLAGFTTTPELRTDAERIAWGAPKITKVANEIEIRGKKGWWNGTKDKWISTQVRTRLLADTKVRSVNINIETRNGVVHLLGLARSKGEIERIVSHARLTPGVKRVVSYMVTPETREQQPAPTPAPEPALAEDELLGGEG